MKLINLLPKTQQTEIRTELVAAQLLNFWVWIVSSMLVLYAVSLATSWQLNLTMKQTEVGIEENKQLLKSAANQQVEKQVLTLNDEIAKINSLRTQHYRWSNALIELANIIGSDMVIDLLELDRATSKVKISGFAEDRESVLRFWADMHKATYFKNINFPLANLEKAEDTPYSFTFYINEEQIKLE